jgi:hypothetical protein
MPKWSGYGVANMGGIQTEAGSVFHPRLLVSGDSSGRVLTPHTDDRFASPSGRKRIGREGEKNGDRGGAADSRT